MNVSGRCIWETTLPSDNFMKQRLVQKQVQKLVMTQDLRQSIELLQYSSLELKDRIEQEMIENPFLELAETDASADRPAREESDQAGEAVHYDDASDYSGLPDREASDRKQQAIENTAAMAHGLAAHLLEQIHLTDLTEEEQSVAEVLVSALDARGLLTEDPEVLVRESGFDPRHARKVQRVIASLDPPGCAARTVQESLIFQAELHPEKETAADAIVLLRNFLAELEEMKLPLIVESSGLSEERVNRAIELIRSLEPIPARRFSSQTVEYIVPDVIVMEIDGSLRVFLNDSWIPDLRINEDYAKILEAEAFHTMKAEDKEYLRSRLHSASFLIRAIKQRQRTLLRTMKAIVDFQEEFFRCGPGHLRPLTLRTIAEELNLHESTVSRITSNKYVQTRWGVFELKYFFARGLKKLDGTEGESATGVQDRIRALIEAETEPLSDQEIANLLKKEGIRIARRTVAKYRGILGIPVAELRRKHKKE